MKGNKSFLKRLKVTKNGKIVARVPGQNHFNAKARSRARTKKGRKVAFPMSTRARRRFLAGQ